MTDPHLQDLDDVEPDKRCDWCDGPMLGNHRADAHYCTSTCRASKSKFYAAWRSMSRYRRTWINPRRPRRTA